MGIAFAAPARRRGLPRRREVLTDCGAPAVLWWGQAESACVGSYRVLVGLGAEPEHRGDQGDVVGIQVAVVDMSRRRAVDRRPGGHDDVLA
jgi:hypothetical protein